MAEHKCNATLPKFADSPRLWAQQYLGHKRSIKREHISSRNGAKEKQAYYLKRDNPSVQTRWPGICCQNSGQFDVWARNARDETQMGIHPVTISQACWEFGVTCWGTKWACSRAQSEREVRLFRRMIESLRQRQACSSLYWEN